MNVRPYDEHTLPSYEAIAATVPVTWVRTADLEPTQPLLVIDRLLALARGEPREGSDPYPHVVRLDGRLLVHDGNHRWMVNLLTGITWTGTRIVDGEPDAG